MEELYRLVFELVKNDAFDLMIDRIFALKADNLPNLYAYFGMNLDGEYFLLVCFGEDDLERLRRLNDFDSALSADYEESLHLMAELERVQIELCDKRDLIEEEVNTTVKMTKKCGISLRGVLEYPVFRRVKYGQAPEVLKDESDENIMKAAMEAALWFVNSFNGNDLEKVCPLINQEKCRLPVLGRNETGYDVSYHELTALLAPVYPEGNKCNEILKKKIQKMDKEGHWYCRLNRLEEGYGWEGGDEIVLAAHPYINNLEEDEIIEVRAVAFYERRTDVVLDKLMEGIIEYGQCPETMIVEDNRTYWLLKKWCESCGISLEKFESDEDALEELLDMYCENDYEDEESIHSRLMDMEFMLDFLLDMPDYELRRAKNEIKELQGLINSYHDTTIPLSIRNKAKRLSEKIEKNEKSNNKDRFTKDLKEISYKISVSLGSGCYRHIVVDGSEFLSDFAQFILDSFEFDNDHAHAFFMNNQIYTRDDSYYSAGVESSESCTDDYRLCQTGLEKGQKFKFLFDFGDDWVFQCRVLDIIPGKLPYKCAIIRTKGDPPNQYGDWH